jgi:hypothetical protein
LRTALLEYPLGFMIIPLGETTVQIEGVFLLRLDRDSKVPFEKLSKKQQQDRFVRPGGVYGYTHSAEVVFNFSSKVYFHMLHYRAAERKGSIRFYCEGELIQERETVQVQEGADWWNKEEFPMNGNAQVDRIVFSQGLDIDLIIIYEDVNYDDFV